VAGAWGGLPRRQGAALLGPQGPECSQCAAQERARRRAPGALRANEIILAEDLHHARQAIEAFARDYGVKWPKAVAKVVDDQEALLTFFDYPAEHWLHLRTTNPIESSFSPVRARTRVTKGPGTRDTGLAMVFKLLQAAEGRWRAVNGPHLVALVRAGARFEKGKLIERPDQTPDKEAGEDVTKVAA
jgi:transposase-like protein